MHLVELNVMSGGVFALRFILLSFYCIFSNLTFHGFQTLRTFCYLWLIELETYETERSAYIFVYLWLLPIKPLFIYFVLFYFRSVVLFIVLPRPLIASHCRSRLKSRINLQ